jgi:hypothetical protein
VNNSCYFDFDAGRGWRKGSDLHEGTCGAKSAKRLLVSAGNARDICHVDNVNHGSHDMVKLCSYLTKCHRSRLDCANHLFVCISVELRRACCRSRNEHLISNSDGTRIAVGVLERIAG